MRSWRRNCRSAACAPPASRTKQPCCAASRVMRNMMVNSASHPFRNQPAIGGPVYWIRNIAYYAPGGSTCLTDGVAGVLFYNNTILTETSAGSSAKVHWRNNLMLGENSPAIFSVNTNTNYSSSDYNGCRVNP